MAIPVGEVYDINGVKVALPAKPKTAYKRSDTKADQYWEAFEYPRELSRISSIFQWHDAPDQFKNQWVDYT